MQLPILVPSNLLYCAEFESDESLFAALLKHPPSLIQFLEAACYDETWALHHIGFMNSACNWCTQQFFQDKLDMKLARNLAQVMRSHFSLSRYYPRDITIKFKDGEAQVNSLLYGSASEFLHEKIRRECRDFRKNILDLPDVGYEEFQFINTYLNENTLHDLYQKEKPAVVKILKLALQFELLDLVKAAENFLKGFISSENVADILIESQQNSWVYLRQSCFDYMNNLHLGMHFEERPIDQMAFEFITFNENAWAFFDKVRPYITELIFSNAAIEDPDFAKALHRCPRLRCLDISYTKSFSEYLKEIPRHLPELKITACTWLTNEIFGELLSYCPLLDKLTMMSDATINFQGWGSLRKLKNLSFLDITRCSQVGNEDLKLILQSCSNLTELLMGECRNVDDNGFIEMSKQNNHFLALGLSRTAISDTSLVALAAACRSLTKLDLTRCENITEKGVLETVKAAPLLRELNISQCAIPISFIKELMRLHPFLHIIS